LAEIVRLLFPCNVLDHTGCRLSMNHRSRRYESHACVRQIIMSKAGRVEEKLQLTYAESSPQAQSLRARRYEPLWLKCLLGQVCVSI